MVVVVAIVVVVARVVVVVVTWVVVVGTVDVLETAVEVGAHPATKTRTATKPLRMASTVTRPGRNRWRRRIGR